MAAQSKAAVIRAAEYVRASTEDQQYSTANQSDAIRAYAALRGMEIVRTYADEGKSGLSIKRRDALKQLIDDVVSGRADFTTILVYDISRWGRFQDADESAYYEYLCRRSGINVHFCVEQFENDGNPYSAIIKSMKRAMAGEYSRELSAKVFAAHSRMVKLGYAQGGLPGYGLRRLLIDRTGMPRFELKKGERKSIATDRVVLIPGPPQEVEAVRWIFEAFAVERKGACEIAKVLNQRCIAAANGRAWTGAFVAQILRCERYVGNYVWNRVSTRLKAGLVRNDPDKWLRAEGVIEPIVKCSLFSTAQEIIHQRSLGLSKEQKLEPLRRLWREHGYLSSSIINADPNSPAASTYSRWFGGLTPTYKLIGYPGHRERRRPRTPYRNGDGVAYNLPTDELLELLRQPLQRYGYVSRKIINQTEGLPSAATYYNRFGSMARVYSLLARFPEHPGNRPLENVQVRVNSIAYNLSNDHLLKRLRELFERRGLLTKEIIDSSKNLPHSATYSRRFGGLAQVYRLVGYVPKPASAKRVGNTH